MKHLIFLFSLVLFCSLFSSGCDLAQPQNKGQGGQAAVQNDPPVEEPPPPPARHQDDENNMVTVAATPGMTGKGNYASANANNAMGIITVPISQYFRVQERLALQQVEAGMNYFKAEQGRAPATQEEFMEKIIQANNIKLPQLPTGQSYVYEGGELKVRKPAQ